MTDEKKTDAATAGQDSGSTKPADPVDDLVATKHQLEVGRRTLDYTATTGRIVLRDEVYEDGTFQGFKAKAEVSITSYTVDTPDGSTSRPVTFAFNGGPGSSSVWLHLGLFGPRRVVMGDVGNLLPPPYGLADNAESLLAVSDLVFIDPVSTGYSRTVEGAKPGSSTATRATSSRSARSSASGPRGTSAGCRRSSSPASPTARSAAPPWSSTCSHGTGCTSTG